MSNSNTSNQGFNNIGLSKNILEALSKKEFCNPTPIQAKAIPLAVQGRDIIGIAQTGTGKTMAFGLPILQKLLENPSHKALIITPTRELALQVEQSIQQISRQLSKPIRSISLIGGEPIYRQNRDLKKRDPHIFVVTPGRLRDHLEQNTVSLEMVKILVLDEADRMLDMGFAPQIKYIIDNLPDNRQTLLFSATLDPKVTQLAQSFQKNPIRIEIEAPTSPIQIKQELCYISQNNKTDVLRKLLDQHTGSIIVFSRTKHGADSISKKVNGFGHLSTQIHSNKSLAQRRQALEGFKNGRYRILVATDVAARGIDVKNIALVVNYDLPDSSEDYVHRIGRTGRASSEGHAISFACHDQRRDVAAIERLLGKTIPLHEYSEKCQPPATHHSSRPSRFQKSQSPRTRFQDSKSQGIQSRKSFHKKFSSRKTSY